MRQACFIFYLSGLLGLSSVREMGAVGMNGGVCMPFSAAGFSPGICVPSSGDIWVSPPRKERLGAFLPLLFAGLLKMAAWVWAWRHVQVWVHPEHEKVPSWDCWNLFLLFCFLMGSGFPCAQEGDNLFPVYYLFDQALRKPCFMTATMHLHVSLLLIKCGRCSEGSAHNHHLTRRHFLAACYEAAYSPV